MNADMFHDMFGVTPKICLFLPSKQLCAPPRGCFGNCIVGSHNFKSFCRGSFTALDLDRLLGKGRVIFVCVVAISTSTRHIHPVSDCVFPATSVSAESEG
jgi:hypothetical protein